MTNYPAESRMVKQDQHWSSQGQRIQRCAMVEVLFVDEIEQLGNLRKTQQLKAQAEWKVEVIRQGLTWMGDLQVHSINIELFRFPHNIHSKESDDRPLV